MMSNNSQTTNGVVKTWLSFADDDECIPTFLFHINSLASSFCVIPTRRYPVSLSHV